MEKDCIFGEIKGKRIEKGQLQNPVPNCWRRNSSQCGLGADIGLTLGSSHQGRPTDPTTDLNC